jgi:hypothetical protein
VWEFNIAGGQCNNPYSIQGQQDFGLRWAGENEALDRLLLGTSSSIETFLMDKGFAKDASEARSLYIEFIGRYGGNLVIPAMPIQDAIDVSRFAVETAGKFARYGLRPETIGGPTEVAAITKHEGFRWVARKHYYTAELNREAEDHGK